MNDESLKKFIDEARNCLPAMRAGVMDYEKDPSQLATLQTVRRHAHTIRSAASNFELSEIAETTREFETELKNVIQNKKPLTEEKASQFLSRILILENSLVRLRESLPEPAVAAPAPEHEEISEDTGSSSASSVGNEDFQIDAEMLEIFAHEAEELLRSINANLTLLEKTPNDREALLEIRRSAHTLKGSAGIVGLPDLSKLAHRIEDLLDFLAESEIEATPQIFELLLAASDCLSALAAGENSPQLNAKISRIYKVFEEISAQFKTEKTIAAAHPEAVSHNKAADRREAEKDSNKLSVETAESKTRELGSANQNRAVVRVSLEKLNALFNLAGEMLTTRSVFEQRLDELKQQIDELHHTTRRIRTATDKLETDFETSLAGSFNSPILPTPPADHKLSSDQKNPFSALGFSDFDALEFDRYTDFHQTTSELIETASDASAINSGLDNLLDNFQLLFENQRRLFEGMQENLLRLRMVPLSSLAPRLQRTVRVTAQEEQKKVDLIIEKDALEIDAEILDSIVDSLLHILRNAVAHGIEPKETRRLLGKPENGKITLRAFSEGTHIVFVITDDGRGISAFELKEKAVQSAFISARDAQNMTDEEALSLIFLPGLTTAERVNQVSGRGVGMNVVKSSIARRQGTITVKSEPQKGTSFTIRIPASLAVTRAVLLKAEEQTFALPLDLVKQVTEISHAEFEQAKAAKKIYAGNNSYSFFYFNELLNLPQSSTAAAATGATDAKVQLLLLKNLESPVALAVDQILKTDEIVVKPLSAVVKNFTQFIGATILGDGSVVAVLDLVHLLKKSQSIGKPAADMPIPTAQNTGKKILIVDDSPSVRQVNSNLIKNAGWKAIIARDGMEALEILQESKELPDAILTDVEMPRMDGYELLASLKKQEKLRKIPVIMITSRNSDKHRRKAFDLGASDYLTKPFDDAALLEKIRDLTRGS